ncbi:Flagellin D [Anaerobiospirillum thomasii]|uniref:Flagellin n=1 Tax=Anaerobiospirillum thomasii TaxID=179995 RepID=A0A2X0V4T4_9GAMM|nr:flagellin [Anaerobiospirillum thomasii]SPT69534.1 Flagellin D [Anaerobiospirillum thomasii]SPT71909.1 Flagellin D [Anaerobiospirillum thomasii]
MALFVNTNVSSINGQRNLTNATNSLNTTYQRLSSGLRINSAKDDAAGLQISDRLTSQINGLNQANRNTNDGIAFAQTAEGALDEMSNMMQRIRTLAVQSANGTNNAKDRDAIQQEVTQLSHEITRIACHTKYAGEKFMAGPNNAAQGQPSFLNSKAAVTVQVGAYQGDTLDILFFSSGFVMSAIVDEVLKKKVDGTEGFNKDTGAFTVSKQSLAALAITMADDYIRAIDFQRSVLGAMQNRMESSIRNQSNVAMNVSDARARIRDTDFAEESAKLSQQTIIQQAASSMLTQANSRPQLALSLLG